MDFTSDSFSVTCAPEALVGFLSTPANLYEILPQDRVDNWAATADGCSFTIKGLAKIDLKLKSVSETEVVYTSASDKPFSFDLSIAIAGSESPVVLQAKIEADVNQFMGMMLKVPLTNFLNSLGTTISAKYAGA